MADNRPMIHVRVESEMHESLKRIAYANSVSINSIVEVALEKHVKNELKKANTKIAESVTGL